MEISTNRKNSFVLQKQWKEQIAFLSDEQKGRLLWAMYQYQCDKKPFEPDDVLLQVIWSTVKQVFDYNEEKYLETCRHNRENIKKRWEKQKSDTPVYDCIRSDTNYTDNDNDNDNEIDNDNDNDFDNDEAKINENNNFSDDFSKNVENLSSIYYFNDKLGLTAEEFESLKMRMPLDYFGRYMQRLLNNPDYSNRYMLVKKWAAQDGW